MHGRGEADDPLLEILLIQRLIRIGKVIRVSVPQPVSVLIVLLNEIRQAPLNVRSVTNRSLPVIAFDVPNVCLRYPWIVGIADIAVLRPLRCRLLLPGIRVGIGHCRITSGLSRQAALPGTPVVLFMNCSIGQSDPAPAVAIVSEI